MSFNFSPGILNCGGGNPMPLGLNGADWDIRGGGQLADYLRRTSDFVCSKFIKSPLTSTQVLPSQIAPNRFSFDTHGLAFLKNTFTAPKAFYSASFHHIKLA